MSPVYCSLAEKAISRSSSIRFLFNRKKCTTTTSKYDTIRIKISTLNCTAQRHFAKTSLSTPSSPAQTTANNDATQLHAATRLPGNGLLPYFPYAASPHRGISRPTVVRLPWQEGTCPPGRFLLAFGGCVAVPLRAVSIPEVVAPMQGIAVDTPEAARCMQGHRQPKINRDRGCSEHFRCRRKRMRCVYGATL